MLNPPQPHCRNGNGASCGTMSLAPDCSSLSKGRKISAPMAAARLAKARRQYRKLNMVPEGDKRTLDLDYDKKL
jgi:hypothetical protein